MGNASAKDQLCEQCKDRRKYTKARTLCNECHTLFCIPCSDNHKQRDATKNHTIVYLPKQSVLQDNPSILKQTSTYVNKDEFGSDFFKEDKLGSDFLEKDQLTDDTVLYRGAQVAVENVFDASKLVARTPQEQADYTRLKAETLLEFSLKGLEDNSEVKVTGVLCVSDNLVVVDYNKALILFDQSGTYLSSTKLKEATLGITYVRDSTFATCGVGKLIYMWTVRKQTIVKENVSYHLDRNARSIYYNGTYFCVLHLGNSITLLDRQGRQVRDILIKEAYGRQFTFGFDIHMDIDTNNIFVTCCKEDGILCMTIEGQALWFAPLSYPLIITEIQTQLCVANLCSHSLYLLTKKGKYVGTLFDKKDLEGKLTFVYGWECNLYIVLVHAMKTVLHVAVCSEVFKGEMHDQYGLKKLNSPLVASHAEESARNVIERLKKDHKDSCFGIFRRSDDRIFVIGYDTNMNENKTITYQVDGINNIMKHPFSISEEAIRANTYTRTKISAIQTTSDLTLIHECIKTNASKLWSRHSNLRIITGDFVMSRKGKYILKPCIVFYCMSKGYIPLHEDLLPRKLSCKYGSLDTDVREGYFVLGPCTLRGNANSFNDPICMGSSVGSCMRNVSGSLGLFVNLPNNEKGFLTCCHVLFDCIYPNLFEYELTPGGVEHKVIQPGNEAFCDNPNKICGVIKKGIFRPGNPITTSVSVDAALVKVTSRFPSSGHFVIHTITQAKEAGYSEVDLPVFQSGAVRRKLITSDHDRPLLKSGTSSGLTKSVFKLNGAEVRVFNEGVALGINTGTPIVMKGQYEVLSDSIYNQFFNPGDSGSAVFLKEIGSLTCIGIAIGKTSYGTAVVTPIGAILDELHLKVTDVTKFP